MSPGTRVLFGLVETDKDRIRSYTGRFRPFLLLIKFLSRHTREGGNKTTTLTGVIKGRRAGDHGHRRMLIKLKEKENGIKNRKGEEHSMMEGGRT